MIHSQHRLPITRQAQLVGLSRGSVYYQPKPVSPSDLALLISSSSGKSPNMVNGALKTKQMGLNVVTLSGFCRDNPFRKLGDNEM